MENRRFIDSSEDGCFVHLSVRGPAGEGKNAWDEG